MLGYQPRFDTPVRFDGPAEAGNTFLGKNIVNWHYGANRQIVGATADDGTELLRNSVGDWYTKPEPV